MSTKHSQPEALIEMWSILIRHRWRFILPAFLITAIMLGASLFLPRRYESKAVFERQTDMVLTEMLSRGASRNFVDPVGSLSSQIADTQALEELVEVFRQSPEVMAALEADGKTLETFREEIAHKINIHKQLFGADRAQFEVSLISSNPLLSERAVNTLVDLYIRRTRVAMESKLRESAGFFDQRMQENQKQIDELENRKLAFEIEHADLLPDNPAGITENLESVEKELFETKRLYEIAVTREQALSKQISETEETIPVLVQEKNPELTRLEDRLRETMDKIRHHRNVLKMTEKHPDMIDLMQVQADIEEKLSSIEKEVVTQKRIEVNPKLAELQLMHTQAVAERDSLESKTEALTANFADLQKEAERVFPVRASYREIVRDVEAAQSQLHFWEGNKRRVALALDAESGNRGIQLDLIKPAALQHRPVSPHLTQIIVAAIGLGLTGGALSVFLAHRADDTFASAEQLGSTMELPIIGSVSEIIAQRRRRVRHVRRMVMYPIAVAAMGTSLLALIGLLYVTLERPDIMNQLKNQPGSLLKSQLGSQWSANLPDRTE